MLVAGRDRSCAAGVDIEPWCIKIAGRAVGRSGGRAVGRSGGRAGGRSGVRRVISCAGRADVRGGDVVVEAGFADGARGGAPATGDSLKEVTAGSPRRGNAGREAYGIVVEAGGKLATCHET